MANLGNQTRKDQVLAHLRLYQNEWVDGPEIANERVGGSEGLRRLRELLTDGWNIQSRRHPDPHRDIWQYKLVTRGSASPVTRTDQGYVYIPEPTTVVERKNEDTIEPLPDLFAFKERPKKIAFGDVAVCPRCRGKTQRYRYRGGGGQLLHNDPVKPKTACIQCNGWGMVPNAGPIAMTAPEGM